MEAWREGRIAWFGGMEGGENSIAWRHGGREEKHVLEAWREGRLACFGGIEKGMEGGEFSMI